MRDGGGIPHELLAVSNRDSGFTVHVGSGWYGMERDKNHLWQWTAHRADFELRRFPYAHEPATPPSHLQFSLVGFVPCEVEIRQEGSLLWRGTAPLVGKMIDLSTHSLRWDELGRATLTFVTSDAPKAESENADARQLAFAVYDLRINPSVNPKVDETNP